MSGRLAGFQIEQCQLSFLPGVIFLLTSRGLLQQLGPTNPVASCHGPSPVGGAGLPGAGGREGGREGGVSDGVPQEEGGERRSGPFITMDLSRWLYSNAKKLSGKVRDFDLASPPASSTPPPLGCSFQKVMEGGCWRKGPGLG